METTLTTTSPDQQLVNLFLHGRSPHTIRAYRSDVDRLMAFVAKPLTLVTLADLQGFADTLRGEADTKRRTLAAVKSLFAFGFRIGFLAFDVGRPLKLPKPPNRLAERILTEQQVQALIGAASEGRNRVILTLLYATGVRVSELCDLRWRDCVERAAGGQVTVFGKGSKSRTIRLKASVWSQLQSLRPLIDDPEAEVVGLTPSSVLRIVQNCALRANVAVHVVSHSFRHSHASHSLDHGAPVHLVSATLGHSSLASTTKYSHARPDESSGMFLAV